MKLVSIISTLLLFTSSTTLAFKGSDELNLQGSNSNIDKLVHPLLQAKAIPDHYFEVEERKTTGKLGHFSPSTEPTAFKTFAYMDPIKTGHAGQTDISKSAAIDIAVKFASSSKMLKGAASLAPGTRLVVKGATRSAVSSADKGTLARNPGKAKSHLIYHIYLSQVYCDNELSTSSSSLDDCLEITNANANVNVDGRTGRVISFGHNILSSEDEIESFQSALACDEKEAFQKMALHFLREKQNKNDDDDSIDDKAFLSENEEIYDLEWLNLDALTVINADDEEKSRDFSASSDELFDHDLYHVTRPRRLIKHSKSDSPAQVTPALVLESTWVLGEEDDELVERKVLRPVWNIKADFDHHWVDATVCTRDGIVRTVNDYVSYLSADQAANYKVYPVGVNDPSEGSRKLVKHPEDPLASPHGWHDAKELIKGKGVTTKGNNVYAQENWGGKTLNPKAASIKRPISNSPNNTFAYKIDLDTAPHDYVNAAVTNLFFWNNKMHDISYLYGFDEESGNFQELNYERGGLGGDAVTANAQDGEGFNNANFATPPDGQRPRMRMYLWNLDTPNRDGDLDAGIIIHEYSHGLSTRLTGGPQNSNCLAFGEAGGMGEGWGDFIATLLRQRPEYHRGMDFLMGSYVYNGKTIRKYPYSTSMKTNPSTYSFIKKWSYYGVHAKGEVWAVILLEAYWNFIDAYGFDADWHNGSGGNNKILKDVIMGMKLQPCSPTFVDARNAILQADEVNFNSDNMCLLWAGFAKRGLGVNAKAGGKDDFTVPAECELEDGEEGNIPRTPVVTKKERVKQQRT